MHTWRGQEASSCSGHTAWDLGSLSRPRRPGGVLESHESAVPGGKLRKLHSAVRKGFMNSPATSKDRTSNKLFRGTSFYVHQKVLPTVWEGLSPSCNPSETVFTDLPTGIPLGWFWVLPSWQSELAITLLIGSYFWNYETKLVFPFSPGYLIKAERNIINAHIASRKFVTSKVTHLSSQDLGGRDCWLQNEPLSQKQE